MARRLVVKVTVAAEALERCNQAFTVSALGVASGAEVSLWLTGEATWLAVAGRAEQLVLPEATPLADLRDAVLAGGTLTVCTQCAVRRELTPEDFLPGVRVAGAQVFLEEVLADDTQALVY